MTSDIEFLKIADRIFIDIPANEIAEFKKGVNSYEVGERYSVIIKIYERGFLDAINLIKENNRCQKNLQKVKKQLHENS